MPREIKTKIIRPKPKIESLKLFWITLTYTTIFLVIITIGTYLLWDQPNFSIAYVPIDVLEWAFIGGMIGVLYRLAYHPHALEKANFTAWIVAKPVIGVVMGGLIYYLAVSGSIFLNGSSTIKNTELLDVIAFIGGFSDKLTISLINKIIDKSFGDDDENDKRRTKKSAASYQFQVLSQDKTA